MEKHYTACNTEIVPDLRVLGYDAQWGNVDPAQWSDRERELQRGVFSPFFDGWFDVILDDGRKALYNGERMIVQGAYKSDPTPDKRINP